MTTRTVWSCDLCGADVAKKDVRCFYGSPGLSTSSQTRDVGPCCWQQPIARLIEAFAPKPKEAP